MQKGFATLEVILMVMVIGILASIAVPRFTSVTAAANTAKIQSDLSTIDTAIAVYEMEKGSEPTSISDLNTYFQGNTVPKPPTGKCYMGTEEPTAIPAGEYEIADVAVSSDANSTKTKRAVLGTDKKKAEDFYIKKSGD